MTRILTGSLALALLGTAAAMAQQAPPPASMGAQEQVSPGQTPETAKPPSAPDSTTPAPPQSQPQAPIADQAAPAAVGPAQANTTSGPAANAPAAPAQANTPAGAPTPAAVAALPPPPPGPMGATAQTMPSLFSEENARKDKLPLIAMQFPMSEEQKRLITASVAKAPKTASQAGLSEAKVSHTLPITVAMEDFPAELKTQFPPAAKYKFVKLDGRVLIVDPVNLTVVSEIAM